jgi:hypothetical protein
MFVALAWAAFWLILPERSWAASGQEGQSDLALVLAVDASGSIDARDFTLQLNGIASAFRHSEVLDAIQSGPAGAIHVALLLWGGEIDETVSSGWFRISTEGEAEQFAAHITTAARRAYYGTTAMRSWRRWSSFKRLLKGLTGIALMFPETARRPPCFVVDMLPFRPLTLGSLQRASMSQSMHSPMVPPKRRDDDGFAMTVNRADAFGKAIQSKLLREIRPLRLTRPLIPQRPSMRLLLASDAQTP